ncbi:protein kinase domain-containing protein [Zavarzinella formosa]|uniref:protein kinase domain-containing protein n=1 Tax=Zavarzinella formosa TaxID=360055 RepID=UPI0002EEC4B5|nr:protein kinase [Zavarzinella formosa]
MSDLLTHPPTEDLAAFGLGLLDEAATQAISDHLAECEECQQAVAVSPGDTFTDLLAGAKTVLDAPPPGEALPPELAAHPRYTPLRLLGVGGMGTVWLAEHAIMGRRVAVKVIRPEFLARPGAANRFRREVAAAARLHHPNIVTAFDAEQAGETHFLAMEYVNGVGLDELLKEKGAISVSEACRYIVDAAIGLEHAHRTGLVHRDVKPGNLMRAAGGTVKVLDFGLAMLVADDRADASLTGANMVVGTPDYIAPEQAEHPHAADGRADIYALGCTLYHLLTGAVPFPGSSVLKKLDAHRRDQPKPLGQFRTDIPRGLSEIVMKMMAKDPAARFQTAAAVAEALQPFADGAIVPMRPRSYSVAAGFAFVALLLLGTVIYRIQTDKGELVISTESDDVEVLVKQGGRLVTIIDTKTQKQIELKSGEYDLELRNADGLKLDITKAALTRGSKQLATIERVPKPDAKTAAKTDDKPLWIEEGFKALDKNQDGRIQLGELPENHVLRHEWDHCDTNDDGVCDFEEFKRFMMARLKLVPPGIPGMAPGMPGGTNPGIVTPDDPNVMPTFPGPSSTRVVSPPVYEPPMDTPGAMPYFPGAPGGPGMPPPLGGPDRLPAAHWPPLELPAASGFMARLPIKHADVGGLQFSPDSRMVILNDSSKLEILETTTGKPIATHQSDSTIEVCAFTPDSSKVIFVIRPSPNNYQFVQWRPATGEIRQIGDPIRFRNQFTSLCVQTGNQKLVLGTTDGYLVYDMVAKAMTRRVSGAPDHLGGDDENQPRLGTESRILSGNGETVYTVANEWPRNSPTVGAIPPTVPGTAPRPVKQHLLINRLTDQEASTIRIALPGTFLKVFDIPRTLGNPKETAAFGVMCQTTPNEMKVVTYDALGNSASELTIPGKEDMIKELATRAFRAVTNSGGDKGAFEALDLTTGLKRSLIAKIPIWDSTDLSGDGRVFAARTETGWNLYRLPDPPKPPILTPSRGQKKKEDLGVPSVPKTGSPAPGGDSNIPPAGIPEGPSDRPRVVSPNDLSGNIGLPKKEDHAHWPPAALPAAGFMARLPFKYANITTARFSPDSRLIGFSSNSEPGDILEILESATGKMVSVIKTDKRHAAWGFTPDSSKIVLVTRSAPNTYEFNVWSLGTGGQQPLGEPIRLANPIHTVAVQGNLQKLVLGDAAGTYHIYDIAAKAIPRRIVVRPTEAKGNPSGFQIIRQTVSANRERAYSVIAERKSEGFIHYLRIDQLTGEETEPIRINLPDSTVNVFEIPLKSGSPQTAPVFGVLTVTNAGEIQTRLYDAFGKPVGDLPLIPKTHDIRNIAANARRAIVTPQGKTDTFEALDLAEGQKRMPIAKFPDFDTTVLSEDGRAFGVHTASGWFLHRLPDPPETPILPPKKETSGAIPKFAKPEKGHSIILQADGEIRLDGQPIALNELATKLAPEANIVNIVNIVIDGKAPFDRVKQFQEEMDRIKMRGHSAPAEPEPSPREKIEQIHLAANGGLTLNGNFISIEQVRQLPDGSVVRVTAEKDASATRLKMLLSELMPLKIKLTIIDMGRPKD